MEAQKHASRFDLRYDTYSGLWCHKPMKELGFECDFVKLRPIRMWPLRESIRSTTFCSSVMPTVSCPLVTVIGLFEPRRSGRPKKTQHCLTQTRLGYRLRKGCWLARKLTPVGRARGAAVA